MPSRAKPTDLTEVEEEYLQSCIVNYRSTPSAEKESFRENCARYIMRQRSLEDNIYVFDLFLGKVRNWFQNHAQKAKTSRLPMRINQGFSAKRVFALHNEALIRQEVGQRKEAADGEELHHLATWNDSTRHLWQELPADEKRVFEKMAEKWDAEGPEEAVKPLLAEKRAPSWMRSVASMFWSQCGMPIFIYGMYKDKDGALHAAVYDTSNLWRETDKSAPLFRNVPGWDQDFRRVAWNFFQAVLRPDLAAPETLQVMKASQRHPPAPVTFALHPDQCPILYDNEVTVDGKAMPNSRRQEIFREFFRAHYNLAVGRETRAPPWTSMRERPSYFFADGMLPAGFKFNDPSHIGEAMLIPFFDHVINMENPTSPDVPARRFRFDQFEQGTGDNRTYHPAVYSGIVEAAAPRRTKKGVTVPEFEDPPPSPAAASLGSRHSQSPLPDTPTRPSPLAAALAADFEAARAEVASELAAAPSTIASTRPKRAAAAAASKPPLSNPWLDAEVDAAAQASADESDLTEDEFVLQSGGEQEASDEEVEDFLNGELARETNDLAAEGPIPGAPAAEGMSAATSAVDSATAPVAGTRHKPPLHTVPEVGEHLASDEPPQLGDLQAPAEVATDSVSRAAFLQSLSTGKEYVDLLQRVYDAIRETPKIRAQSPVFWGTWAHRSPHVPDTIHTTDNKVTQLIKWIKRDRATLANAADVQRFCLVVGLCLRDLTVLATTDGISTYIPGSVTRSALQPQYRQDILMACAAAFTQPPPGNPSGPTRRSARAAARRT